MMAILRICGTAGCNTKTLGDHCLEHELAGPGALREPSVELQRPPQLLIPAGGFETTSVRAELAVPGSV